MSTWPTLGLTSAMATLLVMLHPAQAGQHEISSEDVESYLQEIQRQATEMVQAQELHRMVEWIERNIADGAVFQVSINAVHGDEAKGFAVLTLDREDLLRVGSVFAGAFQQQEIEGYSLGVEVTDVISHGPGAATARVRWTESMALVATAPGQSAESGPEAGRLRIEQVADCSHVFQRAEEQEHLKIGLSTCTAELRL